MGLMPIQFIIKCRRLMYWWHIKSTNDSSLIHKVYRAQKIDPVKNDWVNQVNQDKKDFNINFDDVQIRKISKDAFKKKVKRGARSAALNYLNSLKETHSKLENIEFNNLECQEYFNDKRLSPNEVKLLFNLRTRMFNCKDNFKNQYQEDIWCQLCKFFVDCQSHLMQCPILKECVPELKKNSLVKYEDIFRDTDSQVKAIKLLVKIIEVRELLLNQKKS